MFSFVLLLLIITLLNCLYKTSQCNFLRFRVDLVKSAMQEVLNDELSSKQYDAEETTKWSKEISDSIKDKLKSRFCIRAVNGGKY